MAKREMRALGRRSFLQTGAAAGVGMALAGTGLDATAARQQRAVKTSPLLDFKVAPIDMVRIGYVGVGGMGSAHVRNLLKIEGAQIRAVCDIVPEKVARVQKWVEEAGPAEARGLLERA